jgi:tetratricopeptide (TPR) repeat protein
LSRSSRVRQATLSLLALGFLAPSTPGWAAADESSGPVLRAAARALEAGDATQALELYLALLPGLDAAPAPARRETLEGALSACQALASARRLAPARTGLLALMLATRGEPLGPDFSRQVRQALERVAFDLVMTGQPAPAVEALQALLADGPATAMRWALLARAHVEAGELDRAAETLERGLRQHPDAPELLFVRAALTGTLAEMAVARANYASAESMLQTAVDDLEQAAAREPGAAGLQRALGKLRAGLWVYAQATGQHARALDLLQAAEDAYAEAGRLDPENPEAVLELAELLASARDPVWAEVTFTEARRRYQALADRTDMPPVLREASRAQAERCLAQWLRCRTRRLFALTSAARWEEARELLERTAQKLRGSGLSAEPLRALIAAQARRFEARRAALTAERGSADAQAELGELWLQRGAWDQAEAAFRAALALPPGRLGRAELEDRLYGVRALPERSRSESFRVGELEVRLTRPEDLDAGLLRDLLERAHALTAGLFEHHLRGPLELRVLMNRRAFQEQAGVGVGPHQSGAYALGRVITYHAPARSRAAWLDILVHELAHRYVDELSYTRAPRWLSEGLAQWAAAPLSAARAHRLATLGREGGVAWGALEEAFAARAGDPEALADLYLQAHAMVSWLVARHGLDRVLVLLAVLRAGREPAAALALAFGRPAGELEDDFWKEIR